CLVLIADCQNCAARRSLPGIERQVAIKTSPPSSCARFQNPFDLSMLQATTWMLHPTPVGRQAVGTRPIGRPAPIRSDPGARILPWDARSFFCPRGLESRARRPISPAVPPGGRFLAAMLALAMGDC